MSKIQLCSDITVNLIDSCGDDSRVVAAAKVSTTAKEAEKYLTANPEDNAGLTKYLMKMRHGTPFEHGMITFYLHAPAMVWWEWVRHRVHHSIDSPDLCPEMSFSLESGRYRELDPVFWVPKRTRKLIKIEGYKSARPIFTEADTTTYREVCDELESAYNQQWSAYQHLLSMNIGNEVARAALGFGIYYSGWITCNPRSAMSFLSLRTHDPNAKYVSYPQAEINESANYLESFLAARWPIVHAAFCEFGRVAP